jgi:hypothetical protein
MNPITYLIVIPIVYYCVERKGIQTIKINKHTFEQLNQGELASDFTTLFS